MICINAMYLCRFFITLSSSQDHFILSRFKPEMKFLYFFIVLFAHKGFSQNILHGRIIDGERKLPLEMANVFIANTTMHTTTNAEGTFSIKVPLSGFQLAVSFVGYGAVAIPSNAFANLTTVFVIELFPETNSIKPVNILSLKKRQQMLKIFRDNLLGTSAIADKAKILNLDEVSIDLTDDILTVTSDNALEIVNPELNYRITFLLSHFMMNFKTHMSSYTGYPSFSDLKPVTDKNRKQILKRRKQAYLGSPMHFMRSVYNDQFMEEGFVVNSFTKTLNPAFSPATHHGAGLMIVKVENPQFVPQFLIHMTQKNLWQQDFILQQDHKKYLQIDDYLEIIYTKESEEARYFERLHRQEGFQVSQVKTEKSGIELFSNGNISDSQHFIYFGYMSWKQLADMLPYDYIAD